MGPSSQSRKNLGARLTARGEAGSPPPPTTLSLGIAHPTRPGAERDAHVRLGCAPERTGARDPARVRTSSAGPCLVWRGRRPLPPSPPPRSFPDSPVDSISLATAKGGRRGGPRPTEAAYLPINSYIRQHPYLWGHQRSHPAPTRGPQLPAGLVLVMGNRGQLTHPRGGPRDLDQNMVVPAPSLPPPPARGKCPWPVLSMKS